jgi:hypothetical protein
MSCKQVVDSKGESFKVELVKVDRTRSRVMFEISQLNARFIFTVTHRPQIIQDSDRQVIDPEKQSTLHVSRSLYRAMASWAGSIIHDRR